MTRPELSVVIPTKNRAEYCRSAVKGVLAFPGNIEVIVQDSSTDDTTQDSLRKISDERLLYFRVSSTLSMTENFETSLQRATGEYVVMIGDDDGLSPWIWECIALARQNGADSLVTRTMSLQYYWPDFRSKYRGTALASRLVIAGFPYSGNTAEIDLERERQLFLRCAGQGPLNLPRVYHGLVHRDLLAAMRQRFGRLFFGVSPDVSFAYAAACVSRKHICVDYPVSVSGSAGGSNAGRGARREHTGDLEADPLLQNYKPLLWQDEIPRFVSVETVWGQATVTVLEVAGRTNNVRYSFGRLYALCLLRHWNRRREISRAMKTYLRMSGEWGIALYWTVILSMTATLFSDFKRAWAVITRRVSRSAANNVHVAADVAEAMDHLRRLKADSN
jgi:hypothetical protein